MFTLSIEHAITDFPTWKMAFDRFADARDQAGVLADRIRRPIDDAKYLVIDLDFETKERAEAFCHLLTTVVWSNPEHRRAYPVDRRHGSCNQSRRAIESREAPVHRAGSSPVSHAAGSKSVPKHAGETPYMPDTYIAHTAGWEALISAEGARWSWCTLCGDSVMPESLREHLTVSSDSDLARRRQADLALVHLRRDESVWWVRARGAGNAAESWANLECLHGHAAGARARVGGGR